ncbi:unnamed protein product, partial [Choristocarpus tenellus]
VESGNALDEGVIHTTSSNSGNIKSVPLESAIAADRDTRGGNGRPCMITPEKTSRKKLQSPPWPSDGRKEFLRSFIERNRSQMWMYDPSFVGVDHKTAYK